jgi:hypothetical protein
MRIIDQLKQRRNDLPRGRAQFLAFGQQRFSSAYLPLSNGRFVAQIDERGA